MTKRTQYKLLKKSLMYPFIRCNHASLDEPSQNNNATVLGAFVLTLNWKPAAFFCKILQISMTYPSQSLPERSNW